MEYQPCQRASVPLPQARSTFTSQLAKGIQSIPRSRSQAASASAGLQLPGAFSYETTVIHWPGWAHMPLIVTISGIMPSRRLGHECRDLSPPSRFAAEECVRAAV